MSNVFQEKIKQEVTPQLIKTLGVENKLALPRLSKIVVNMGVKNVLSDKKYMQSAISVLSQITGQKPKITKAKKAISAFKLRKGDQIGLVVTLRGKRMYDFFNKLVAVLLPRLRDFHGISRKHFDGHGNYTLGFAEYAVFPEIDLGKVDIAQGLEICIVTSAKSDKEGIILLEALGMPFTKAKSSK